MGFKLIILEAPTILSFEKKINPVIAIDMLPKNK